MATRKKKNYPPRKQKAGDSLLISRRHGGRSPCPLLAQPRIKRSSKEKRSPSPSQGPRTSPFYTTISSSFGRRLPHRWGRAHTTHETWVPTSHDSEIFPRLPRPGGRTKPETSSPALKGNERSTSSGRGATSGGVDHPAVGRGWRHPARQHSGDGDLRKKTESALPKAARLRSVPLYFECNPATSCPARTHRCPTSIKQCAQKDSSGRKYRGSEAFVGKRLHRESIVHC